MKYPIPKGYQNEEKLFLIENSFPREYAKKF